MRIKNVSKLIKGNLNVNSISNKFDQLGLLLEGKFNILIIIETKLDSRFSYSQFLMNSYSESCRFDINRNGARVPNYI